jgi:hypothetical protein
MKPHKAVAPFLMCAAALLLQAKDKKQPSVPAALGEARYVYVEATGGREFDPNLDAADREAIADVRDALRAWGRYSYTPERAQADLVIVVRKGRAAGTDAGASRGGAADPGFGSGPGAQFPGQPRGNAPPGGPAVQAGDELGPAEDLFEVCPMNANGKRGSPLWQRSMPDGLTAPRLVLFRQFKEAVDKAYPNQAQGQPASQPGDPASKP